MNQTRVLDTDVISFLFKDDSRKKLYDPHVEGKVLVMSFMTLAELDYWVIHRNWGERRAAELRAYLRQYVIYPFHRSLRRTWASVTRQAYLNGRPITCSDAWIAATAIFQNLPPVTHNHGDFEGLSEIGLHVISEGPA